MPSSQPLHPRVPVGRRRLAADEVLAMERANVLIQDLLAGLDRQLEHEARVAERVRMLREAANQITRAANDAVHAYRRGRRAVTAALEHPNGNREVALEVGARLQAARGDVLVTLEHARHHYEAVGEPVVGPAGQRAP